MVERQAVVDFRMNILREQAHVVDFLINQQLSHTALRTGKMRP